MLTIALGTIVTRALPFIIFPAHKKTPAYLLYLGKVLPSASIGFLVVYCLQGVSVTAPPYGLPEAIAVLFTVALHYWKNNTLLSIGAGTVLFMIMVQFVFV
jgi:branched-subunit amino acid transport protein AzlD